MAVEPERKRRKISASASRDSLVSRPKKARSRNAALPTDNFFKNASGWNLEQDYESRPRKLKAITKERKRLPIKNEEGRLEHVDDPSEASDAGDSFLGTDDEEHGENSEPGQAAEDAPSTEEEIRESQEELARIADLINQDPEEHISGLKTLAKFSQSKNTTIRKLGLVTQLAVFKDIIPGYRIRPRGDAALQEKLSKEVRRLMTFEQGLVGSYQNYVQVLAFTVKSSRDASPEAISVSKVALSCICQLILAVPHFNFRGELLKPLVSKIGRRKMDDGYHRCISTLEQLFRDDEDGNASREAVGMLAQMMKTKEYQVDESVVNTFLHLRLLTELNMKGSKDGVGDDDSRTMKGKKLKQKREYLNKKQRKARKEIKELEKEFAEADASVQHEEREKMQAETLKIVFACYFRILKTRSPKLMGAVLEGLARYAHLINQDFFGDLLVTLQELATQALSNLDTDSAEDDNDASDLPTGEAVLSATATRGNALRSALLCTTTAFALLSSQDAASLNLDLSSFVKMLHTLLVPLCNSPDLELSAKTPRLPDPYVQQQRTKVNATALSTLLVRALSSALAPRGTPPVRLAAFAHRLMMCSLQVPEKTATAMVALVREIVRAHGRRIRGIWSTEEQRGDGRFDPLGGIESCRPFCGTVWEGELLRLHFADGVRKGTGELEALVKDLA